jgi:putative transposase
VPTVLADEDALTRAIVALASEYGRYGYRRVTALLQAGGRQVGKDRVQRIWRREGLKVPQKHRPRSRLWLNDGSCATSSSATSPATGTMPTCGARR